MLTILIYHYYVLKVVNQLTMNFVCDCQIMFFLYL